MLGILVGTAHAADAASGSSEAAMGNIIFMVLLFAVFYFLLIRPQQKQAKEHREMVENLQRGDSVVTAGGIMGRVHKVEDDVAVVEIAELEGDGPRRPVRVKVRKSTITAVTAKLGAAAKEE